MSVKNSIEEAEQAWSSWKRFGAKLSALGSVGVGLLIFFGPAEMRNELPGYQIWATGFIVFGVIFFVALSGKGGFYSRAKNFLVFLLLGGIGAFCTWIALLADTEGWGVIGYGSFAILCSYLGIERFWAMLTGKAAWDEEDIYGNPKS